ncbi:MAG: hypothetical protein ACI9SB_001399 [Candidatus Azotimanducaceae bacterium]|jgi:hypothetical protein
MADMMFGRLPLDNETASLNNLIALEIGVDDGSCYPASRNSADKGRHYVAVGA